MKPTASDAGFTLLELLVAFAIASLAFAVVLPAKGRSGPVVSVRSAAANLAAELRAARAEAMRTSSEKSVTINLDQRTFWTGEFGIVRSIPVGIAIGATSRNIDWSATHIAKIYFEPDGGSAGGHFLLTDRGEKAAVVVDWMTGATNVQR